MTFYEAAIQILLRTGHPLHAKEIAEIAVREGLLSHVGKEPEVTMASRLAAMARRSQDRRIVVVETDTFGLSDWNLQGSAEALETSGLPEEHDETEPPLRGRERHPPIDKENVRVSGRSDRRRRHEEVDRKKKRRMGPVPEFVFDLLGRVAIPVPLFELAAAVREKDLVADDLGREALAALLTAENEKREEDGRRPLFVLYDGGLAGVQGGQGPSEEEVDYPALVAKALAKMSEDRKAAPVAAVQPAVADGVVKAVAEQRQRAIRQLRRRLSELEAPALEAVATAMLESMGYADPRVAKRHKEGALFITRRRMGLTEIRFAVRVIRGNRDVRREDILELRKDMGSHSAQMGVIVSPSDVTREAKNEASQASQSLVTLLCADALADQLAERGVGVTVRTVSYVDFDDAAFRSLLRRTPAAEVDEKGEVGKRSESAAEERRERRERERKEWRERRQKEREERRRLRAEAEAAAGGGAAPTGEGEEAIASAPTDSSEEAAASTASAESMEWTEVRAEEGTAAGEAVDSTVPVAPTEEGTIPPEAGAEHPEEKSVPESAADEGSGLDVEAESVEASSEDVAGAAAEAALSSPADAAAPVGDEDVSIEDVSIEAERDEIAPPSLRDEGQEAEAPTGLEESPSPDEGVESAQRRSSGDES